ncbi:hypothetical protein DFH06DRAFT_718062 [Mycena polygramma]|nr:hypothetical protein DFH06DRAFT_718062 [Mycena polygramma]
MSVKLSKLQAPTIRDRLRHNVLPSDSERSTIMESLVVAREQLRKDWALDAVERTALRSYISEYSSLLAPIRRLTHDILEKVFAGPEISQMIRIGSLTPALVVGRDPYLLASICHYWMCVALQTHELWSKFAINACGDDYALSKLRTCLERSGTLPLSIDLTLPAIAFGGYASQLVHNRDILDALMSNAERWGHLRISMRKENVAVLAPVHGRLHRLQELSFNFDVPLGTPSGPSTAFSVAPKLRIVRFEVLRRIDEIHVLPFHQIKTVEFSTASSSVYCDALSKFPNVQDLVVTNSRSGPAQYPQLHATLKKITLGRGDGYQPDAMAVFHRLTAPNLEEIHFFDYIWDSTSITEFLTRSACSLQILSLESVRVRAGELLAVLRHTPTLHTLELRDSIPNSLTDILISALLPVVGPETLLPALKNIIFVGTYLFSTTIILRMLEERAASLHFVNLVLINRQVGPADRARFAALRRASPGVWRLSCLTEERETFVF